MIAFARVVRPLCAERIVQELPGTEAAASLTGTRCVRSANCAEDRVLGRRVSRFGEVKLLSVAQVNGGPWGLSGRLEKGCVHCR